VSRYIDEHRGRFGVEPICTIVQGALGRGHLPRRLVPVRIEDLAVGAQQLDAHLSQAVAQLIAQTLAAQPVMQVRAQPHKAVPLGLGLRRGVGAGRRITAVDALHHRRIEPGDEVGEHGHGTLEVHPATAELHRYLMTQHGGGHALGHHRATASRVPANCHSASCCWRSRSAMRCCSRRIALLE
jgi:hypothetical protein